MARHADDHLGAADLLLDGVAGDARARLVALDVARDALARGARAVGAHHVEHDAADVGLVHDVRAHDLDHHGEAETLGHGDTFATTGPIIEFTLNGVGMGDSLIIPAASPVTVAVTVRAAPWIPLQEVRMIVNGEEAVTWNVIGNNPDDPFSTDPADCVRLSKRFTLPFAEDAWVIFEAGFKLPVPGVQPPSTGLYRYITSGHLPVAFTNPVFVRSTP